jgi:hypothetical protein
MKPIEIVLTRRGEEKGENDGEGKSNWYNVTIYVNITMYPPVQVLYANKFCKNT